MHHHPGRSVPRQQLGRHPAAGTGCAQVDDWALLHAPVAGVAAIVCAAFAASLVLGVPVFAHWWQGARIRDDATFYPDSETQGAPPADIEQDRDRHTDELNAP